MEEALEHSSKKRKRSSCHPLMGVFTRSKSQIYLHCNRSGRARKDSFRHADQFQSCNRKPRPKSLSQDSSDTDDWSSIIIKDLRTRRVFSFNSTVNDCVYSEDTKGSEKGSKRFEDGVSDSKNLEGISSASFVDKQDSSKGQGCTNLPVTAEDAEISNEVGGMNEEECVQATPPDADILNNMEHVCPQLSTENLNKGNFCTKNGNNSAPISVLNLWSSRAKVFRAPGSFSYRRLLPYLMDMVQDNSCDPQMDNSPNIEKQQISIDKLEAQNSFMGNQAENNSCMRVNSSTPPLVVGNFSNSPADKMNEKIKMQVSWKEKNLERLNPDCSARLDHQCISGYSNDTKPMDYVEAKGTANDTRHDLSLMAEKLQLRDDDTVAKQSRDTMQTEILGIQALEMRHACKNIDPNHLSSNVSEREGNSCIEKKEGDDNDGLDKTDDSNENSLQKTSPDADIYSKPVQYQNADYNSKFGSWKSDQIPAKPSNGSTYRNNRHCAEKRMESNSKSKLGLNPCSRLKIFKSASSLSYRRMLPYLTDIAKDHSGDSANKHCLKAEKSLEENSPSQLPMCNIDKAPLGKSNDLSHQVERNTDSCILQMDLFSATKHTSDSNQLNLMSTDNNRKTPITVGSEEEELQLVDVRLDHKDEKSDAVPAIVSLVHGSSSVTMPLRASLVSPKPFSGICLDLVSHELSLNNEESGRTPVHKLTNGENPVATSSLSQKLPKLEASDSLGIPAHDSMKGILRKNPRGCRGLCPCLNCASFRLHSDKAFEFSRNQMQDAEEVALDLIKELSEMRNMLQNVVVDSNDNLVICINQVEKACMRAFEAEEIAKSRLSQMNYDLNIHCRITCVQRPRVRFSNDHEERIISQVN